MKQPTMLLDFHSFESGEVQRKQFVHWRTIGELELLTFKSDANDDYASLFLRFGDQAIYARFNVDTVARCPDRIPVTVDDWRGKVREMLLGMVADSRGLPSDALQFGFDASDIEAANRQRDNRNAIKAAQEEERRERLEREATEKEAARLEGIRQRIAAKGEVSGRELLDAASTLAIAVAPQTVGMIRKRVETIDYQRAQITGKGNIDSAFRLYRECYETLAKAA